MVSEADVFKAVRLEMGDIPEPFRDSYRGQGGQRSYDLSASNLITDSITAYTVSPEDATTTSLVLDTDYTVDAQAGILALTDPLADDVLLIVEGTSYGIFSDDELGTFIDAALSQHLKDRHVERRFRDGRGFIKYESEQMGLDDLPAEEKILVVLLATIEALWALSTDASMDIDISTSEGTHIPRSQRYRQLTAQIDLLTDKYKELSLLMGVGLFAPEVMTMRRVSRTTGRLVPIFRPREYDEHGEPVRKIPARSNKDIDPDGPRSPWWAGGRGH